MTELKNRRYIDELTERDKEIEVQYQVYLKLFEVDLPKVTDDTVDVSAEAIKISSLRHKYSNFHWIEENKLKAVEIEHKKYVYAYARFLMKKPIDDKTVDMFSLETIDANRDETWIKQTVEDSMQVDSTYCALTKVLAKQTRLVRVIKETTEALVDRGRNLGTAGRKQRHNDGNWN